VLVIGVHSLLDGSVATYLYDGTLAAHEQQKCGSKIRMKQNSSCMHSGQQRKQLNDQTIHVAVDVREASKAETMTC
jgi:3-mercaptopyruvate sulfurtransferase SseA